MNNALLPDTFQDRLSRYNWLKLLLPIALTGLSLYLISSALLSVDSFLNKPIPTGSTAELLGFASGAFFVAALIAGGLFALYLSARLVAYLRSEHQAKLLAAQIIARASSLENGICPALRMRIKIAH